MTKAEILTFIEEMGKIDDNWTEEQVQDVYGSYSLADALPITKWRRKAPAFRHGDISRRF